MSNKEDLNKVEQEEVSKNEIEEVTSEPVQEEIVETIEDVIVEEKPKKAGVPVAKRIFANILDQAITLGFSAVMLVIFGLIIKIFGYGIAMPVPLLLIAYVVVNILYYPLFEKTDGKTIGKRILAID